MLEIGIIFAFCVLLACLGFIAGYITGTGGGENLTIHRDALGRFTKG